MMICNSIKAIIIPDVHGRDFWRASVQKAIKETDAKIIFLGDYTDPYTHEFCEDGVFTNENIQSWGELSKHVIETLEEIIELKKNYPDRVVLLLGNHDCGYMIGTHICSCRHERPVYAKIIDKLFMDNRQLFQLAHEETINGIHYIFSHAGINKNYAWDCFFEEVNEDNVVKLFNDAFHNDNYGIMNSLGYYSIWRGYSGNQYGSLIWADAREWIQDGQEAYGFSVVGHTQLTTHRIEDKFAFLDCHKCFSLDENNKFEIYD